MQRSFVHTINDPQGNLSSWIQSAKFLESASGHFVLALGSTCTSDIEGVSAAGVTPQARRLTPCVDAEALVLGKTLDGGTIPASPLGIVSPVVITRPALAFLNLQTTIVDCGTFKSPGVPHLQLRKHPANCLSSGQALDAEEVEFLYHSGKLLGQEIADNNSYLIIGECVPGGTTSALGVLTALGFQVGSLLSSSLPQNNHSLRESLVSQGLKHSNLTAADFTSDPLKAVAAVGDPMQAFAAGMCQTASQKIPVLLAGGSQMLAVWALMTCLDKASNTAMAAGKIAVITTKWVAFDPQAQVSKLAGLVNAPFAAACPDFMQSRHSGLQAYEQGNVKEGMGAGGSMAAAHLIAGAKPELIMQAIDGCYDDLVLSGKAPELDFVVR